MTLESNGGKIIILESTPTVEASPDYSTGDLLGGKQTIALPEPLRSGEAFFIRSVTITDKTAQTGDIDVVFFTSNPSGATYTENSAYAPAAADVPKIAGAALVREHVDFSGGGVSQKTGLDLPVISTDGNLYAVMVARATINLASASDLTLRIAIERA